MLDLVKKIIDISGKTSLKPVVKGEGKVKGEIDEQYLSSQKAKDLLGWKHKVSLEEGLSKTINWYRQYFANA